MSGKEEDVRLKVEEADEYLSLHSGNNSLYDGNEWNLSERNLDSSVSLSQFSLATTNTADITSSLMETLSSGDRNLSPNLSTGDGCAETSSPPPSKTKGLHGSTLINEKHVNFVLMYEMLTGIRISTSSCQAKPARPLTNRDFTKVEKLGFDAEGNEMTPSSRFDFKFKDYAPWVFRYIREVSKVDAADYLVSLTGKYALSEIGSSGKSGSFFYYSQDLRFIIKTVRRSEHMFLRKILPYYYEHLRTNPNSLLTRIFGLHRLRMSSTRKIYFVVMGNIFPPSKQVHEIYDLKGSTQGRYVKPADIEEGVPVTLKDLNWVESDRKLILGPEKATLLMNQLKSDCQFLAKLNIMDYSLLVGLHSVPRGNTRVKAVTVMEPSRDSSHRFKRSEVSINHGDAVPKEKKSNDFYSDEGGFRSSLLDNSPGDELYFLGVIDILTPYDSKKKLEHLIKSLHYDKDAISAVSPTEYCKRFLRFMADNIIQDKGADYANKVLPEVPADFTIEENGEEGVVIIQST